MAVSGTEALGKMKLIWKQIAEVMIAFTIPYTLLLCQRKLFYAMTIGAYKQKRVR